MLSKTQPSHSPQPSGWGISDTYVAGNHFNGFGVNFRFFVQAFRNDCPAFPRELLPE